MPTGATNFTLSYSGRSTDDHEIDLYDLAQALVGFQRSLALTTHLILNDEVITQAPSLKGATILCRPPAPGSLIVSASVIFTAGALYKLSTAAKDTPLGNLVRSAYDYVISELLGFHVDYDKTLGQQYEELRRDKSGIPNLSQPRFDSLVEKCEVAVREMHRPIVWSQSATTGQVYFDGKGKRKRLGPPLNRDSFEYIRATEQSDNVWHFTGRVSSYNINTFRGRVFVPEESRPIPFELVSDARDAGTVALITESLTLNAQSKWSGPGDLQFGALRRTSKSGRLKGLRVLEVSR